MKTFVRLIRRYVLAAVGIVLLLVFLGLGLLVFLGWQETTHLPQRTYASSEIADAMVETPAGLALGAAHTPEEWMDGYAWAMVLDDTGNIRWSYALPDALNHTYTTGEVAGFAHWYLDDYPVFCWAEDYGLFVIGLARGSLWKCSIYTSPEYILSLAKTIPLGFGLLLLLAAICCFLLSWQGAKRLETVASGLDALAEGQTVQLPTEGFAGELAEKLNPGSRLRATALGGGKTVLKTVGSIPGIRKVEIESEADGQVTFTAESADASDRRAEVSRALSEAGCTVLELTAENRSLEEVFLALTGETADVPEEPETEPKGE